MSHAESGNTLTSRSRMSRCLLPALVLLGQDVVSLLLLLPGADEEGHGRHGVGAGRAGGGPGAGEGRPRGRLGRRQHRTQLVLVPPRGRHHPPLPLPVSLPVEGGGRLGRSHRPPPLQHGRHHELRAAEGLALAHARPGHLWQIRMASPRPSLPEVTVVVVVVMVMVTVAVLQVGDEVPPSPLSPHPGPVPLPVRVGQPEGPVDVAAHPARPVGVQEHGQRRGERRQRQRRRPDLRREGGHQLGLALQEEQEEVGRPAADQDEEEEGRGAGGAGFLVVAEGRADLAQAVAHGDVRQADPALLALQRPHPPVHHGRPRLGQAALPDPDASSPSSSSSSSSVAANVGLVVVSHAGATVPVRVVVVDVPAKGVVDAVQGGGAGRVPSGALGAVVRGHEDAGVDVD